MPGTERSSSAENHTADAADSHSNAAAHSGIRRGLSPRQGPQHSLTSTPRGQALPQNGRLPNPEAADQLGGASSSFASPCRSQDADGRWAVSRGCHGLPEACSIGSSKADSSRMYFATAAATFAACAAPMSPHSPAGNMPLQGRRVPEILVRQTPPPLSWDSTFCRTLLSLFFFPCLSPAWQYISHN